MRRMVFACALASLGASLGASCKKPPPPAPVHSYKNPEAPRLTELAETMAREERAAFVRKEYAGVFCADALKSVDELVDETDKELRARLDAVKSYCEREFPREAINSLLDAAKARLAKGEEYGPCAEGVAEGLSMKFKSPDVAAAYARFAAWCATDYASAQIEKTIKPVRDKMASDLKESDNLCLTAVAEVEEVGRKYENASIKTKIEAALKLCNYDVKIALVEQLLTAAEAKRRTAPSEIAVADECVMVNLHLESLAEHFAKDEKVQALQTRAGASCKIDLGGPAPPT